MISPAKMGHTSPDSLDALRPARLVHAAQEFESYLMKELTAPLVKRDCLAEESDQEEGSSGALGEFAANALAQALSRDGGLGIAEQVLQHFPSLGTAAAGGPIADFVSNCNKLSVHR